MKGITLILLVVYFFRFSTACRVDEDCNLNGVCTSGSCVCDYGWKGTDCGALDARPVSRNNGFNLTSQGISSWCSSIVQDPKNASVYHAFISKFTNHCGLTYWNPYSQIIRAESHTGPLGPYTYTAVVASHFAHNPTVIYSPADNQYLLYHIGCPQTVNQNQCQQFDFTCGPGNSVDGESGITVLSSPDLRTWTSHGQIFRGVDSNNAWDADITNPSAFPLYSSANHTASILLAYRGCPENCGGTEQIALASSPNFTGPYTKLNAGQPLFANASEDPFVWRDGRGNWHLLVHSVEAGGGFGDGPKVGRHAFARGLGGPWTFNSKTLAYTTEVQFTGGYTVDFYRRERPQLLFDTKGRPIVLTTGVQERGTDASYSVMVPLGSG